MSFVDEFQNVSIDELRQEVIDLLKEAYTDGRISVESLERRLSEATAAESKEHHHHREDHHDGAPGLPDRLFRE